MVATKKTVAILCGGQSSEHEISCISASGVLASIDRKKFDPIVIGITKKGNWVYVEDPTVLEISEGQLSYGEAPRLSEEHAHGMHRRHST